MPYKSEKQRKYFHAHLNSLPIGSKQYNKWKKVVDKFDAHSVDESHELLTEKDNRQFIISKLGLPQEAADFAHKISDKYSIWIANVIKNNFPNGYNILENEFKNVIEMFKDENKPVLDIKNLNWDTALNYYNLYTYIKDWRDSPDVPSVNLKNMSWEEAERLSREWHSSLGGGGKVSDILDEKDKIIHKFSNGFYWVLREDSRCEKSRQSMGHCATASKSDMYLFRLIKNDEEFITADWHPTDRYIMQLKGKANTKPKEIYYPYIMWLIADSGYIDELRTNKGYSTETNFHLSDLNEQQLKHVISKNPNIINLLDILSKSEDKIKNIINLLGDDLNKVVIKLATEKFEDLANALLMKDSGDGKNLISLLFKFFGKTFINNLNSKNLSYLLYRMTSLEGVAVEDEDKVKSKLIDYILETGGEEFYYRLTTKEFVNKATTNFMFIKSKTKGINKFILNLLKINGKEMLMNFDEEEIQHLFFYVKKTSLIKFIKLFIKIGGEDFLNKIAKNEKFISSLYIYTYQIQNKDEVINDMIKIGGKNFLMNLTEKNITTILWLTSNRDELINKIINIGGEDFIKSLSVNGVDEFIRASSYGNQNQIKSLFQQYGKLPKEEPRTPMNEIFNSLTSLQEELNEQNKLNVKQKNLEKVKQFLLEKKNLLNEISIQDAYNNYYKEKVSEQDFNEIVKADPFSKPNFLSPYSKWMIGRYVQNHIKLEDLPAFTEYIQTYDRYKDKYKNVDWNQLFTKFDLYNVVKDDIAYSQAKTGNVNLCEPIDGSEKFYEDENWCIIVPKTEYAACYYGRNTEWCTAWGEMSFDERHKGKTNRFQGYNNREPLYIIINKNNQNEKYQFHFVDMDRESNYNEAYEFKDKNDNLITQNSNLFKKLIKIFYDNNTFLSDEASNKVKVMYKLAINNLKKDDITNFILNSENKKESINLLDSKYDNLGTDFLNALTWKDLNNFNVFERINGVISYSKSNAVYDFLVKNNNVINNLDEVGLDFMLNNTSNRTETINILLNNYNIVNNIRNINSIIKKAKNPKEVINFLNKKYNGLGTDFINSLSSNSPGLTSEDKIKYLIRDSPNPEEIKEILQQYGILPKDDSNTPLNEIFKSLTSLQEELNEQNKVNIKEKNLEKVKQFLIEKKNLLTEISVQDAYNNYYKEKVSEEDFNEIVKADPFSKPNFLSKYSKWMLKRYEEKHIKLEDLPAFTEYIKAYERYKDKYKNVDWNKLFTKDDLYNVVKDDLAYSQAKTGTVNLCEPIDGSEKIYEDSKWCIITPKTEYTACYYGRNTEWCTAWGEMSFDERHKGKTSRFESHHRQGPLYIIINRNNQDEKYQFHFESNQFKDINDREVNKNSETFKELIDIFSKDEVLDKLKGETRVKLLILNGRILEKLTKENIIYLKEYDIKHILSITPKENHENIILNLLSVGGKKIAMSLVNFPEIISYISEENRLKFIINLLTVGGKEFLMDFYFFSQLLNYFPNTKITTDIINLMIKIGGKEFLVDKLPSSEELLNMIIYYKGLNFIDKLLSIGGKEFVMNLSKNDRNIDRIMKAGGRSISGNEPSKIIIAKKLLSVGGKDFIMKLSRYYKPLNIILVYIGKGKVDSLINYIIKIGGKDFLINSESHLIYSLLNYSSNPGKLFISLLLIGGEDFVMNFKFFENNTFTSGEKDNVFKYFENSKVSTDVINIILKIGGKDFVMNLKEREVFIILLNSGFGSDARNKMIKKLISIGGKELILKFKNVNILGSPLIVPSGDYQLLKKTIQIGGKEYVEKLDYNVMTDIIINTPKEKINELFVMMLNLGGKEFVKNLDEELLKDIFKTEFLKDETKTKIRNIIKQNNIKIKIDEQRKVSLKERNLMKVQNFIKMKRNNH